MKRKDITGIKNNYLTAIKYLRTNKNGQAVWEFDCDCGNKTETTVSRFQNGDRKSCGCMNRINIKPDEIYGGFKVIERTNKKSKGNYIYKCLCLRCGNEKDVLSTYLINGIVMSCGCLKDEVTRENFESAYKKHFKDDTSIPKIKSIEAMKNNKSGYRGVSYDARKGKYRAVISFQKKTYFLGYYDTPVLASEAYQIAKKELHEKYLSELE